MGSERRTARKPVALVATAIVVALAALLTAGGASAKVRGITGIHDARYCELFEMTGTLPDAKVVVWNTIGLNDCPEKKWEAIDTAALAEERGATLIVKNGPRHFLMDAASAKTGKVDTLGGIEMRKVATIPISSPADLDRSPYTERTIGRTNDWKWKRGRKVFVLLAPNGANYLMQSYSQEIDPSQSIGDLKKLGKRLELPKGWEYRARKLKRPLTLKARGEATILQDDLRNTYQRLPRKKGDKRTTHTLDVEGITKQTGTNPDGSINDAGTITGKPFGPGTIDIVVKFGPNSTVTGTFDIGTDDGAAFGTLAMTYVIEGGEIHFTGTASFTGGTGLYRGIKGKDLPATDDNTLDGQNGRLTLEGDVKY